MCLVHNPYSLVDNLCHLYRCTIASHGLSFLSVPRVIFLVLYMQIRNKLSVVPISDFFASSLWFGNTAYLQISVAFIQMLKALMCFNELLI
ncbi:hypothetical protein K1719_015126 [Acacia pycnantha]|nr:hypothetical protein K1719_015126 [Acacia pycnantha]